MASALSDIGATVLGKIDLAIHFPKADRPTTIHTTAYVVSGLSHTCFLGSDLMSSKILRTISPDAIFLANPTDPYDPSNPTKGCAIVPIYSRKFKTTETLLAAETALLTPGLNWVQAKIPKINKSHAILTCATMDIVVPYDNDNPVVPIMHHDTEAVYLDKDDPIPSWSLSDSLHSEIDICSLMSFHDLPINAPEDTLPEAFTLLDELAETDDLPVSDGEKPKSTAEMVNAVVMDHLPAEVQQKYRKLLTENIDVFSRTSTDIGCTPLFHGYANVKPGLDPVDFRTKYYPPAQAHQHHVRKLLKQLLQAAIIRQTTQPVPCLANIHVRVKPNGKLRLCLDSRAANFYTERLAAVTTYTLDEMISKFHNRLVTMIDVSQSFFQIPLEEGSKKHFSFQGPDRKIYQLNRVSQGHHNSPLFLNHTMNIILMIPTTPDKPDFEPLTEEQAVALSAQTTQGPMRTTFSQKGKTDQSNISDVQFDDAPIAIYSIYDDLAITSDDKSEHDLHIKALQLLFNKMRKGNMKLRIEKMQLTPKTLTILGMQYDATHLIIPPSRFAAWWKMPVDTAARIRRFVQSAAYFRSFCPSFSRLTRKLLIASNESPFKHTPEYEEEKTTLLRTMEANCKRRTITASDKLIVSTDASKYDCGATLEVVLPHNRTELVSSYSRLFQKHEINHDIFAKEVAAMVGALNHFSYYLRGSRNITIRTDVRGLLYIKATSTKNQTSFRLSVELSKYDAQLIHVPTNAHSVPDAISRARVDSKTASDSDSHGMTPAEAETLMKLIYIEHGRRFTKAEALSLITDEAYKTIIKPRAERYGLKAPDMSPDKSPRKTIVRPNFIRDTPSNTGPGWNLGKGAAKPFVVFALNAIDEIDDQQGNDQSPIDDGTQISDPENPDTNSPESEQDDDGYIDQHPHPIGETSPALLPLALLRAAENTLKHGAMSLKDFKNLQELDPDLERYLKNSNIGMTINKDGLAVLKDRFYLPKSLLRHAVEAIHNCGVNMHTPKFMTFRKLGNVFYRPNLQKEVDDIYSECFTCAAAHPRSLPKVILMETFEPKAPRQAWYIDVMDLTEPVATISNCPRYAIVACDAFSNYIVIAPIPDRNKETLSKALIYVILTPFGRPAAIISDNESGVASDHTQSMLAANQIRCHLISPKSPWANKAERAIRTLKQTLSATLLLKRDYTNVLPTIMTLVNSIPRPPTAISASQLFFFTDDTNHRSIFPMSAPKPQKEMMDKIRRAQDCLLSERKRKRVHANRTRTDRTYEPGELVFLREPTVQAGHKLLAPAGELHIVRERTPGNAYLIEKLNTKEPIKRHASFIFPAQLSERVRLLNPDWDELLEEAICRDAADTTGRVPSAD